MRKQTFASPEEALVHYGKKGMKWGVRSEEDFVGDTPASAKKTANTNAITKEYIAIVRKEASKPVSKAQVQTNLKENSKKFENKFEPKGADPKESKGLSPKQKKLLIGGVAAVGIAGGLYAYSRYSGGNVYTKFNPSSIKPGQKVDGETYRMLVGKSWKKTATTGHLTEAALARPAFELPAGHTFYRLSKANETHWGIGHKLITMDVNNGTYAVSSLEDLNRYVAGFRGEKGTAIDDKLHKVMFQSTKPIKIPSVTDIIETLRESETNSGRPIDREGALKMYRSMIGSGWIDDRQLSLLGALKAKGYGALVDEMDAGVIGQQPLVVFGGESNYTAKTSVRMGAEGIKAAENALTEISNRRV